MSVSRELSVQPSKLETYVRHSHLILADRGGERDDEVACTLARLTSDQLEAVYLIAYDMHTFVTAAAIADVHVNTMRNRWDSALGVLRRALEPNPTDGVSWRIQQVLDAYC